ncbi:hypothetical protein [Mesorhizobium sp. CN2-181]|uniref:hypothetical protein n=1 Tax=Mesorhizobium yinganensis TaxID=3157707 RepID=UPI0032B7E554
MRRGNVNSDDLVIETANGGTDIVNAHSNYVLAADAHVEVLQSNDPGGTFARDMTGNTFAQTIIGGTAPTGCTTAARARPASSSPSSRSASPSPMRTSPSHRPSHTIRHMSSIHAGA